MKEHHQVSLLLFAVIFVYAFLFGVAYTNASFEKTERPLPEVIPASITMNLERNVDAAVDNFVWSWNETYQQFKDPVISFLGLEGYKYGQPRYTSLVSQPQIIEEPYVLGAYEEIGSLSYYSE